MQEVAVDLVLPERARSYEQRRKDDFGVFFTT